MDRATYLDRLGKAYKRRDALDQWSARPKRWNDPLPATQSPRQPNYWDPPVQSAVANVVEPAAANPAKGSGPVTAEEIVAARQLEFRHRLAAAHEWRLAHL